MAIFKYFAKAIYNKAELSTIPDVVDEIEIDKIRNVAEIFPFTVVFVFKDSRNLYLPSVVVRREGERPWVRGCDQTPQPTSME